MNYVVRLQSRQLFHKQTEDGGDLTAQTGIGETSGFTFLSTFDSNGILRYICVLYYDECL